MKSLKPITTFVAIASVAAVLASKASAQALISDFNTVNPMAIAIGDGSWAGDVTQEGGHQTVGLTTALQSGGGAATFAPIDLGSSTELALTASRIAGDNNGVFRIILESAAGFATRWDFTPSLFPSEDVNTANTGNFGTVTLNVSDGVQVGSSGPADLHAVTVFAVTGDGTATTFQGRFENLSAVPEPAFYALVTGLGLVGFAFYRRFACKAPAAV
jgi:hypothetical protein